MKIHLKTVFALLLLSNLLIAQIPLKINYQGLLRTESGFNRSNESVVLTITIFNIDKVFYVEKHSITTDAKGGFSLKIGNGNVIQGDFATIDWPAKNLYVKTEVDGKIISTTELTSVPYAHYADKVVGLDKMNERIKQDSLRINDIKMNDIKQIRDSLKNLYTTATMSLNNPYVLSKNFGKTVGIFGGSFSVFPESEKAKEIWRSYLGLKITDYGYPGAGFSSLQPTAHNIQRQVDQAAVHDIYILWASLNDYGNNKTCGEYNSTDLTTQCGGINYCIKKLFEKNPNCTIYFFLSVKYFAGEGGYNPFSLQVNATGKNLAYYVEQQKKCCERYGIPYLDQFNLSGFNEFNYSQYYRTDLTHLNEAGYRNLGFLQVSFLANGR